MVSGSCTWDLCLLAFSMQGCTKAPSHQHTSESEAIWQTLMQVVWLRDMGAQHGSDGSGNLVKRCTFGATIGVSQSGCAVVHALRNWGCQLKALMMGFQWARRLPTSTGWSSDSSI